MENKNTVNLELLRKIPEHEMKSLIAGYLDYVAKYKYLRYIILAVFAIIMGYNFFVAGKRFEVGQLQTIKTILVIVMGIIIMLLIVLGVKLFKALKQLKKDISRSAEKNHADVKMLRKEFHKYVKTNLGGPGLR